MPALTGAETLKTGSRTIPIPEDLRPIIELRARSGDFIFPEPKGKSRAKPRAQKVVTRKRPYTPAEGGLPWRDPKMFNRRFKKSLAKAAIDAKVNMAMDSRIGRRTCASLLLQANISANKIAALLGNSAEQILDSYGDPDIKNLTMGATELKEEKKTTEKSKVS